MYVCFQPLALRDAEKQIRKENLFFLAERCAERSLVIARDLTDQLQGFCPFFCQA